MNYFDILEFQGVGHGMPQDSEEANIDPNHVTRPLQTPKTPLVYPHMGPLIDDT